MGCKTKGVSGYAVNRWGINRPPNGTKFDRRSTSGVPRPLGKSGPFRESLTPAHEKRQKGVPKDVGVPDRKMDNGEIARMHETNTYANAMHMMT